MADGQKQPEIVFLWGDDWTAMYFDGKKVAEGHSLNAKDVLDVLNWNYTSQEAKSEIVTEDGFSFEGQEKEYDFPDKL